MEWELVLSSKADQIACSQKSTKQSIVTSAGGVIKHF